MALSKKTLTRIVLFSVLTVGMVVACILHRNAHDIAAYGLGYALLVTLLVCLFIGNDRLDRATRVSVSPEEIRLPRAPTVAVRVTRTTPNRELNGLNGASKTPTWTEPS